MGKKVITVRHWVLLLTVLTFIIAHVVVSAAPPPSGGETPAEGEGDEGITQTKLMMFLIVLIILGAYSFIRPKVKVQGGEESK